MFRPMRRFKQQLTEAECAQLLHTLPRGVLAVLGDEDYPYAVPMDFWYSQDDGCLYFHSAPAGHKIESLDRHPKASFCAYDEGYRNEGEWALNIRSVIVFGTVSRVEDQQRKEEILWQLGKKYTDDSAYIEKEIAEAARRVAILALKMEHVTGKLVNES